VVSTLNFSHQQPEMNEERTVGLRERKKARTKDQILDAATTLFAANGYPFTAMESIASEADISATTLYNYYGTKGQILLGLIARSDNQVISKEILPAVFTRDDCIKYVCDFIIRLSLRSLKQVDTRTWRYAVAYSIINEDKETSKEDYLPINEALHAHIFDFLMKQKDSGVLDSREDIQMLATMILDNFRALFIRLISREAPSSREYRKLVERYIRACFN